MEDDQIRIKNEKEVSRLQSHIEKDFDVQIDLTSIPKSKIFTGIGDNGNTRIISGEFISKGSTLIETQSMIQLLSTSLGECTSMIDTIIKKNPDNKKLAFISTIIKVSQMDLQDIGTDLSSSVNKNSKKYIDIDYDHIIYLLELILSFIDYMNTPLTQFILPGGHKIASKIFNAGAICRNIEPILTRASEKYEINEGIQKYINRLSDFLFVLARYVNKLFNIPDVIYIK